MKNMRKFASLSECSFFFSFLSYNYVLFVCGQTKKKKKKEEADISITSHKNQLET